MRDLTKVVKDLIGADNVKVFGKQESRGFYMILWGRLKLSIDSHQKDRFFFATVVVQTRKEELIFADTTGPRGFRTQRDLKADELVFFACKAALAYKTSKTKKPTDRLEL